MIHVFASINTTIAFYSSNFLIIKIPYKQIMKNYWPKSWVSRKTTTMKSSKEIRFSRSPYLRIIEASTDLLTGKPWEVTTLKKIAHYFTYFMFALFGAETGEFPSKWNVILYMNCNKPIVYLNCQDTVIWERAYVNYRHWYEFHQLFPLMQSRNDQSTWNFCFHSLTNVFLVMYNSWGYSAQEISSYLCI